MIEQQEKWTTSIKCGFCDITFTATSDNIIYGDLRPPYMFVPDYQYYVPCPQCQHNHIVTDLPSRVAINIQTRGTLIP